MCLLTRAFKEYHVVSNIMLNQKAQTGDSHKMNIMHTIDIKKVGRGIIKV